MTTDPLLFVGTTTDPALPGAPFERVHYSFGQLLGADELQTDQRYHHLRHRIHQLALHGTGVVGGLDVRSVEDELRVTPGLAVDALGRDLFVDTVQCLPVPALHTTDLWPELSSVEEDEPLEEGVPVRDIRIAWVVLRYRSCQTEPVVAYGVGCGSQGGQERPSRTRDTFTLGLEPVPPTPEPWVGSWEAPEVDGTRLEESWRDRWLAHSLALPGDLNHLFDGTHTDVGVALARVVLGIGDDGAGGERTIVLSHSVAVRPLLPRVQTAIEALAGVDLDVAAEPDRLALRQVETLNAVAGAPVELQLHFTGPVALGTLVAGESVVAHGLDGGWSPLAVTIDAGPDDHTVNVEIEPAAAGTPIRLALIGDGPTPIAGPDGRPLSGWSIDTHAPSDTRGRTVAHHLTAPSEAP